MALSLCSICVSDNSLAQDSIIVVGKGSDADYLSIQDAIDNSNPGQEIHVQSGIYNENITVDKPVTLVGSSTQDTRTYGIQVMGEYVNITGFNISGVGNYAKGVYLNDAHYCTIKGNWIANSYSGIFSVDSSNNLIEDNTVIDIRHMGVHLYSNSSNNTILNNKITRIRYNGICLWESSNDNLVSNNMITNNTFDGIELRKSFRNIIERNVFMENQCNIRIELPSQHNRIFNNSFVDYSSNKAYDRGSNNYWDDGVSRGNYWSQYEYNPPDAEKLEYVWDTVHNIDGGGVDHYPLLLPHIIPSIPENFRATIRGQDIVLTWDSPLSEGDSELIGYLIYKRTNSNDMILLDTVGEINSYVDTDIDKDESHYYQIIPYSTVGVGVSSSVVEADLSDFAYIMIYTVIIVLLMIPITIVVLYHRWRKR